MNVMSITDDKPRVQFSRDHACCEACPREDQTDSPRGTIPTATGQRRTPR
jgi:hypothetical protein